MDEHEPGCINIKADTTHYFATIVLHNIRMLELAEDFDFLKERRYE